MNWDKLTPKITVITFIGMIVIFAASIHKTGGGLYWQLEEVKKQNESLEAKIQKNEENNAVLRQKLNNLTNAFVRRMEYQGVVIPNEFKSNIY